jgi:hypothetical protein
MRRLKLKTAKKGLPLPFFSSSARSFKYAALYRSRPPISTSRRKATVGSRRRSQHLLKEVYEKIREKAEAANDK